jgi:glycosyltransferase involved in cell wall biosynthesis
MEAQACGLPAIVTNEGGPKETVDHGVTGLVLANNDPAAWCAAIEQLLDDEPRRAKMSRAAVARMSRMSLQNTFETFWADHLAVVLAGMEQESTVPKDRGSYNPDDGTLKITLS